MTMTDRRDAPRGLKGVIVADTELGDVRGLEGFYHYRQYSAPELAAKRTFEDVWYLLFEGELPTLAARDEYTARIAAARHLPAASCSTCCPAIAAGHAAPAGGAAHRAVAARGGRGHAADLRRRSGDHPGQCAAAGCRDAGARSPRCTARRSVSPLVAPRDDLGRPRTTST